LWSAKHLMYDTLPGQEYPPCHGIPICTSITVGSSVECENKALVCQTYGQGQGKLTPASWAFNHAISAMLLDANYLQQFPSRQTMYSGCARRMHTCTQP
jgi:hypothetical protein